MGRRTSNWESLLCFALPDLRKRPRATGSRKGKRDLIINTARPPDCETLSRPGATTALSTRTAGGWQQCYTGRSKVRLTGRCSWRVFWLRVPGHLRTRARATSTRDGKEPGRRGDGRGDPATQARSGGGGRGRAWSGESGRGSGSAGEGGTGRRVPLETKDTKSPGGRPARGTARSQGGAETGGATLTNASLERASFCNTSRSVLENVPDQPQKVRRREVGGQPQLTAVKLANQLNNGPEGERLEVLFWTTVAGLLQERCLAPPAA